MEYNENDFYGMTSGNSPKMPFYMTYPMQNVFLEEIEYERDMDRLKGMYPQEVRAIQEYVEEECDKMEYEGSLMFDEFPDRLMLRQICNRIHEKVESPKNFEAEQYEDIEAKELRLIGQPDGRMPAFRPPVGTPHRPSGKPDQGLHHLIEVMLFNEMYHRRCRHRRCRRWW